MRIRRQPQLNSQASRADIPIDGSSLSPAVVPSKPPSSPQHCAEDIHISIADLSMIYSASKLRASVNWLDRLRAAKGFSVDSHRHIEEFLSSRACSPEHAQSCHLKLDDATCLKNENTSTPEGGCNGVVDTRNLVAEVFPDRNPESNIVNTSLPPQALSCNSGNAPVESCHSRSLGKYRSLEFAENDMAASKPVSPGVNKSAWSRSPGTPSPMSQDSNAEASLSQLYFNMFADLFCIDSCSLNSLLPADGKKRPRKQEKPKVCSTFADPGSAHAAVASSQLRSSEFALQATPQLDSGTPPSLSGEATPQLDSGSPPSQSGKAIAVASSQLQPSEFSLKATLQLDSGSPPSQSGEATPQVDSGSPPFQSGKATAVVKVDAPSSTMEEEGCENRLGKERETSEKVLTEGNKLKNDEMELERCPMNEVFIIDTSLPGWKTKKYIFRKAKGWKIMDKGVPAPPIKCCNAERKTRKVKKRPEMPHTVNKMKNELTKVPRQYGPSPCKDEKKSDASKSKECSTSTEHVARLWSTAPHTRIRSSRKRRKTYLPEEVAAAVQETPETSSTKGEPVCTAAELADKLTAVTFDVLAQEEIFVSDHPANQPKEGIVYSVYQVFMQAGKAGLTPREAVSRILEQGLPGLHEGRVVSRVEVLKIVSNSPYFMPLEESKFILCSALVGDEEIKAADGKPNRQSSEQKDSFHGQDSLENVKSAEQHGVSHYWAACAAIRRARTGKMRRKPSLGGSYLVNTSHEVQGEIHLLSRKKRLKSVKQDVAGLGNPCNRSDGKGWHCPLRAKVGYLLCDHHLDRLRVRVKSHIKSKMLSVRNASKDERKRVINGAWMVKKVERSSVGGGPSQACFEAHAQDQVLPTTMPLDMSSSRFPEL